MPVSCHCFPGQFHEKVLNLYLSPFPLAFWCMLILNREGADGNDEEHEQIEDNSMDTATLEAAKPSRADGDQEEDTEKLNDDELAEYDLDKYDEEENTGKISLFILSLMQGKWVSLHMHFNA